MPDDPTKKGNSWGDDFVIQNLSRKILPVVRKSGRSSTTSGIHIVYNIKKTISRVVASTPLLDSSTGAKKLGCKYKNGIRQRQSLISEILSGHRAGLKRWCILGEIPSIGMRDKIIKLRYMPLSEEIMVFPARE